MERKKLWRLDLQFIKWYLLYRKCVVNLCQILPDLFGHSSLWMIFFLRVFTPCTFTYYCKTPGYETCVLIKRLCK